MNLEVSDNERNKEKKCFWIIPAVSGFFFLILLIDLLLPDLTLDTQTIIIAVLVAFPWLIPFLKSFSIPNVVSFEFTQAEKASIKGFSEALSASDDQKRINSKSPIENALFDNVFQSVKDDPLYALAYCRIEIERALQHIFAFSHFQPQEMPGGIYQLSQFLFQREIIDRNQFGLIEQLLPIFNQATHGFGKLLASNDLVEVTKACGKLITSLTSKANILKESI